MINYCIAAYVASCYNANPTICNKLRYKNITMRMRVRQIQNDNSNEKQNKYLPSVCTGPKPISKKRFNN